MYRSRIDVNDPEDYPMMFSVRDPDPHRPICAQAQLDALTRIVRPSDIAAALAEAGRSTRRVRKITLEAAIWLVLGMNLFAQVSIDYVWERLTAGLRLLSALDNADDRRLLPSKSALCARRYQLGPRPLRKLFERVCRPLAAPGTCGAFLGGLRLMAIDGHMEDTPDTRENSAVFGRCTGGRGHSAFPQVLCLYLCECGTHAIVGAAFWPATYGELRGIHRLLRSVTPEMLVMWDRGLHDYHLIAAVRARGAHVLGRVPAGVSCTSGRPLPDGSTLAELAPARAKAQVPEETQEVRLIEYTITDPALNPKGQHYRLVTTLLDWKAFPAYGLACAYHERWEIEVTLDEQDTHELQQRHPSAPLRSRKPRGVIQEMYGLCLAHYALRALMHAAAERAGVAPQRLSFTRALRVVQDAVKDLAAAEVLGGSGRGSYLNGIGPSPEGHHTPNGALIRPDRGLTRYSCQERAA